MPSTILISETWFCLQMQSIKFVHAFDISNISHLILWVIYLTYYINYKNLSSRRYFQLFHSDLIEASRLMVLICEDLIAQYVFTFSFDFKKIGTSEKQFHALLSIYMKYYVLCNVCMKKTNKLNRVIPSALYVHLT